MEKKKNNWIVVLIVAIVVIVTVVLIISFGNRPNKADNVGQVMKYLDKCQTWQTSGACVCVSPYTIQESNGQCRCCDHSTQN